MKTLFLNFRTAFLADARHLQILCLSCFLLYGVVRLEWETDIIRVCAVIFTALAVQVGGAFLFQRNRSVSEKLYTMKSGLITALSLCILLKANSVPTLIVAAAVAIGGKFIFRIGKKHLFNPANLGIMAALLLMRDAWIAPAQWGNGEALTFFIGTAGLFVLARVSRIDVSLGFLAAYLLAEFSWNCGWLGWETDVVFHKLTSGSLLLYTFFMITDPMTTPNARIPRIIWAATAGIASCVLANIFYINAAPLWVLFFMTPLTPLVDKFFPAHKFQWRAA